MKLLRELYLEMMCVVLESLMISKIPKNKIRAIFLDHKVLIKSRN